MLRNLRGAGSTALLVFFWLVSYNCFAQTTATATAAVYAVVVQGTSATASNQLDFGKLRRNTGTHGLRPTAPGAASFTVSGQPEAVVSFTFPEVVNLRGPEGKSLALTPDVPTWSVASSQSRSQQLFPSVTGGRASFSSEGVVYVWFGGAINTDGATVGSYTGQYTVTIIY